MNRDERECRYVAAARDGILNRLRAASAVGGRNNALNTAAFQMGQQLGNCGLTYQEAETDLRRVATEIGLMEGDEKRKAVGTIKCGLRDGAKKPRSLDAVLGRGERSGRRRRPTIARTAIPEANPSPVQETKPTPPGEEVRDLWLAAAGVTTDADVSTFLMRRGLDAGRVQDEDLAKAYIHAAPRYTWAGYQCADWPDSGHRLLIPAFDAAGILVTIRARHLGLATDKEVAPRGYTVKGSVYANALGRELLRHGTFPPDFPERARFVLVAEGGPDFLTLSTHYSDGDEDAPAVLGVFSGSWTTEIAARMPSDAVVVVWVHHDDMGNRFAEKIASSLAGRCKVRRSRRDLHAE